MGALQPAGSVSDQSGSIAAQGDGTTTKLAPDAGNGGVPPTPVQLAQLTTIEAAQIVKTGALSLEVADIDQSTTLAKATVAGLGGTVSQSNRSGSDDYLTASITFRVPSARWDDTLTALHKLGSKILSEETNSTDVTSQVVDLDARLDNLKRTETALQAIMNKAVLMADVLAVQNQLTQTQGQIEQLTAQRDHLTNQAAMSTLTVTFQLPSKTVTTQAAQGWTLSGQIDEAGAALVRIGQGLATIGVWLLVVVLPIGFAVLLLLAIVALLRRIFRRDKRQHGIVGA
jgi:cell division protein FtsL